VDVAATTGDPGRAASSVPVDDAETEGSGLRSERARAIDRGVEVTMTLMSTRTWDDWIREYALSHQHPVNRRCHTIGIPLIALSVPLFAAALAVHRLWPLPVALFVVGWIFQFVGHAYEGKGPEFMKDWRFLFVGLRWWLAKVRGRA
jgi:uncharacterized membrane protein YGL010W